MLSYLFSTSLGNTVRLSLPCSAMLYHAGDTRLLSNRAASFLVVMAVFLQQYSLLALQRCRRHRWSRTQSTQVPYSPTRTLYLSSIRSINLSMMIRILCIHFYVAELILHHTRLSCRTVPIFVHCGATIFAPSLSLPPRPLRVYFSHHWPFPLLSYYSSSFIPMHDSPILSFLASCLGRAEMSRPSTLLSKIPSPPSLFPEMALQQVLYRTIPRLNAPTQSTKLCSTPLA